MSAARTGWQAIHQEVLRRIHDRVWRPGEMIPNEAELAREFGCARATVNRALRALAESGTLERRRRAGTRVALHPVLRATLAIPITRLEIEETGARYGYRLLESGLAPAPGGLGCSGPDKALHVRALHLADERPYLLEDRWISMAAVPDVLTADLASESANEWLVRNAPFTDGESILSAAVAGEAEAALLEAVPGAALFVIERTTRDGAAVITTVRLVHAPGYSMRMAVG